MDAERGTLLHSNISKISSIVEFKLGGFVSNRGSGRRHMPEHLVDKV